MYKYKKHKDSMITRKGRVNSNWEDSNFASKGSSGKGKWIPTKETQFIEKPGRKKR